MSRTRHRLLPCAVFVAIALGPANAVALSRSPDPCDQECQAGITEGYRRGVQDCRNGCPGAATAFGSEEYTTGWQKGYRQGFKDCGR
ncbi:hypothetical protein E1292_15375 [Nonomuraea deserti]|uniref:Uncharacterized protein n=1 Tax=Nonomuraea deserti TaxID=1848322 RepID=A0A4R4VSQ2_9ACTN|nr:hypothetical protein [Nonomuraea deserti]TDD06273.1 hypothetical protein E1292_15375 [Nonomuraea deserti]